MGYAFGLLHYFKTRINLLEKEKGMVIMKMCRIKVVNIIYKWKYFKLELINNFT